LKEEIMERKNNITILKKVMALICGIIIIITVIFYNHKYNGDYQMASYHGINSLTQSINENNPYVMINNYQEYQEILDKADNYGWFSLNNQYDSKFFETNSLVCIEILKFGASSMVTELISVKENNKLVNVKIYEDSHGCTADVSGDLYLIPVSKKVTEVNIKYVNDNTYQKENIVGTIIIFIAVVVLFNIFHKRKEKH
jgi:hypothetical protein